MFSDYHSYNRAVLLEEPWTGIRLRGEELADQQTRGDAL